MERVFKDKWSKVVIKTSPRKAGYIASTYLFDGTYAGCKHIQASELEDYIKYVLSDYAEIKE